VIGLSLLKHYLWTVGQMYVERLVYAPYFQYFTGEEFSGMSSLMNART
jgi:hypothetical protein